MFGVLSWLIFAALLAGRHIYGWRGRVAVRWTLAGFLMLVLAYIGSKFVLEVMLGRGLSRLGDAAARRRRAARLDRHARHGRTAIGTARSCLPDTR